MMATTRNINDHLNMLKYFPGGSTVQWGVSVRPGGCKTHGYLLFSRSPVGLRVGPRAQIASTACQGSSVARKNRSGGLVLFN